MAGFCRDCLTDVPDRALRCQSCGSPRLLRHPELHSLTTAHVDCDAFYATIEKRDDPSLADKPLIVGGGQRGVVTTACYVARIHGVRSAMPMFQARRLCPQAVVIKPDMGKYGRVSRQVRTLMLDLTPQVEPISIDEAFLDLSGTERLHGRSAAKSLALFARRVEREIGITVSIGLSGNKFLAKIASDLDKPRGFAVLAPAEAVAFLAPKPVTFIWGVGKRMGELLAHDGFHTIADLQNRSPTDLARLYGAEGERLAHLSRGLDDRAVHPEREAKSISAETTFSADTASLRVLERRLWELSDKVSGRLKANGLAGSTVTVKLKSSRFKLRTRAMSLEAPTNLAAAIFAAGRLLLAREVDGVAYRLIGIGVSNLGAADGFVASADLLESNRKIAAAEGAVDRLREKFGREAVIRGLAFDPEPDDA